MKTATLKLFLALRGTSLWALCGLTGDFCALLSGVHFANPARVVSMAMGMVMALLLWAWGDYGDDRIQGNRLERGLKRTRNFLREVTDRGLPVVRMQKICFTMNILTGLILAMAGMDLTHADNDFRPIEIFYGSCVAMAFTALTLEDRLPVREEAQRKFGKAIGAILHRDNMRRIATICFSPCSIGQIAAGILSHDLFVVLAGVIQSGGAVSLWYSTRIQRQIAAAGN